MIKWVRIVTLFIAAVVTIFSIFYVDSDRELAQAQQAFRGGDMDQALRRARRANGAFSEKDKKVQAYYLQARAASKMNWKGKAQNYLDQLLSLSPNNISGLLFRGELSLHQGENQEALFDLNKGIALGKGKISQQDLAYFLSKRGLAELELGQTNKAVTDAGEALQLAPNLPEAHDLMSKVWEAQGNIKKALAECERAYQLSMEKNKLAFMTPDGRKLSDRLVSLKVKALQTK